VGIEIHTDLPLVFVPLIRISIIFHNDKDRWNLPYNLLKVLGGCCYRESQGIPSCIVVMASDLVAVNCGSLGTNGSQQVWQEWDAPPISSQGCFVEDDYSDLDDLQVLKVEGKDKAGRRILRIVGKHFPASLVSGQRLQKYVYHKISNEIPEGPYCLVYIHTSVQRGENCPGVSTLWLIYEELPPSFKERLQVVYFLHPGIQSRLFFATLGRFFLSAGLYWKLKYVNRLEFLWDCVRKGQIEIPDFVYDHDDQLEDRPLMDYGVETDPFQVYDKPAMGSTDSRYSLRWAS